MLATVISLKTLIYKGILPPLRPMFKGFL